MIKLIDLTKIYNAGVNVGIGVHNINLELHVGEFVAIVGASGSGKTTLLNIISGIDTYTEGDMLINGDSTANFTNEEFENYRRANVAFIFQNYNLIDSYTVLENVMIELSIKGYDKKSAKIKAIELLEKVGMKHRLNNRASQLSGGEKQRVVIARALASDAKILACDEPTGNLDEKNTKEIMSLIKEVSFDKLILFVTHDETLIKDNATRVIKIRDGVIESDTVLEKVNKQNLLINNIGKNSFKTKLDITLKNIIRTPKKTGFVFLVFLILSFIILFSIAYIPLNMMAINNHTIEINMFPNRDENRIVVYTNSNFDGNYNIKNGFIVEKDYLLEYDFKGSSTSMPLNDQLKLESKIVYDKSKLELKYGRFPNENVTNEIMIVSNGDYGEDFYYEVLNSESKIRFLLDKSTGVFFTPFYTIVGFATSSELDESKSHYYFSDSGKIDFYTNLENHLISRKESSNFIKDFSFINNNEKFNIGINDYIENDEIRVSFKYRNDNYRLVLGNKEIDLTKYNVTYKYIDSVEFAAEMNFETAYKILSESKYRVSVFCDQVYLQETIDILRSNKNLEVYPLSESKIDIPIYDYTSIIKNLLSFLFITIEIIVSIFIVSLITSFILSTKKKEIGILRVIGLSKSDVLHVLYMEIITIMMSAIVINILFAFIVNMINPGFVYGIIFNNPIKLLCSIFILLIMAIFIAYKWNKSMFKLTAAEVLKAGE